MIVLEHMVGLASLQQRVERQTPGEGQRRNQIVRCLHFFLRL
jgi:hypothetical protein